MQVKKLVKKDELVELLKENNVKPVLVEVYSKLNDTLLVGKQEYVINNVVTFDENNNAVDIQLNYYCKEKLDFLYPFKIEKDLNKAVSDFINLVLDHK